MSEPIVEYGNDERTTGTCLLLTFGAAPQSAQAGIRQTGMTSAITISTKSGKVVDAGRYDESKRLPGSRKPVSDCEATPKANDKGIL